MKKRTELIKILVWSFLVTGWFMPGMVQAESSQATPAASEIVCIKCHSTLPGRLAEPVRLWRGSIHAENGIACNACHGGDPKDMANAMNRDRGFLGVPKEAEIPGFCGRCHVGVLKDYLTSAHGKRLGHGGPTCVTCHGNHRVIKASLSLINEESCSRCHSFERARVIREAMLGPETLILDLEGKIAEYKRQGTDVDRLEKGLFSARNRFHSLYHNVDAEKVKKETELIVSDLKKLETSLQAIEETKRKRKIAGGIAIAGALLAALLFHLMRKSID